MALFMFVVFRKESFFAYLDLGRCYLRTVCFGFFGVRGIPEG